MKNVPQLKEAACTRAQYGIMETCGTVLAVSSAAAAGDKFCVAELSVEE